MKKIIFIVCMLAVALTALSQTISTSYYTCYQNQMLRKYRNTKEWVTIRENRNIEIPISITGNTLTISAQTASTYTIYSDTKRESERDEFKLISYEAYDIISKRPATVQFVYYKATREVVIGVTYNDDGELTGLHFYVTKN